MKRFLSILFIITVVSFLSIKAIAQPYKQGIKEYQDALKEITLMLEGKEEASFKKAVFLSENAYLDNKLEHNEFLFEIEKLASLCRGFIQVNNLDYEFPDRNEVIKYASVFSIMTDTFFIRSNGKIITHYPITYDFEDFWGEQNWTKMFVSKLLVNKNGNCHSIPYLYKILSDELKAKSFLALAPNHIYIKNWCKKGGWYNTELTSATFPIDAWVIASGYISVQSIQNKIYMDTLSNRQSITLCLMDLAEGFQKKFGKTDPDYILKCTDLALKYYPNYVNAMLLKAETLKYKFELIMKKAGVKYAKEAFYIPEADRLFKEMESLYVKIHEMGYRKMPKEMYLDWLAELHNEKDKYLNKKIIDNNKTTK